MPSLLNRASGFPLVIVLICLAVPVANGQTLANWPLIGTIDSSAGVAGAGVASTVTAGPLTLSPALTPLNDVDAFMAGNWNGVSNFDPGKYMEFSVLAGSGRANIYQSIEFNLFSDFSGTCDWAVRSSIDGFATNLDAGSATSLTGGGQAISANVSALGQVAGQVAFRLYITNNTGTTSPLVRGLRGPFGGGQDLEVRGQTVTVPSVFLDPDVVYTEDFESGTGAWSVAHSSGSPWEYGRPVGPPSAFSGSRAFSIDLDSDYQNSTATTLTATFDCTSFAVDPFFSMRLFYDAEAGWDGVNVEIDTGSGFSVLGNVGQDFNWYDETDVDGFGDGVDGWSGDGGGWQRVAHRLDGAAGSIVTIAINFASDTDFVVGSGAMIDDIHITQLPFTVFGGLFYTEDFESGAGRWQTGGVGTTWERGVPMGGTLSSAFSGSNAFGTDLDGTYADNTDSWIERTFDARLLSNEVALEMQVNYSTESSFDVDIFNVQIDTGSGFQTLGSQDAAGNWYNTGSFGMAPGWSGESGGWRRVARRLNGVEGELFTLRLRLNTNFSVVREGVLVDDIRLVAPTPRFEGTGEDLETRFALGFSSATTVADRASDEVTVRSGDFLSVSFESPMGTFLGSEFVALASIGTVAAPLEVLPNVFLGTTSVLVVTPTALPGGGAHVLPLGGYTFGFTNPGGAANGLTLFLQGLSLTGLANNMIYAGTNVLEVQLRP